MTIAKLNSLETGVEVCQKINEIIDDKADVNADTTGNAGTATKLKTARTITLTGDVTGSASFDGSENKSITTTLGNTTKIDGQWVSSTKTLSTATAIGTYTIDLSTYLPNDNYNYEVKANSIGYRSTSSGDAGYIYVDDATGSQCVLCCSPYSRTGVNCYNVKVGTTRKITLRVVDKAFTTNTTEAICYKRLGSNT